MTVRRIAILAALAATPFAAALPVAGPAAATEIRVGVIQDALTLDPGNHRNRDTETAIRIMCDGLLARDPDMKVVPELAASYRQIDPLTWEFVIRDGVTFHDGTPLTAEDIVFTFNRLIGDKALGGQTSPRKGLLGPVTAVELAGPKLVRFKMSAPWPILPAMLPFQEMLSKAFVAKVGDDKVATEVNCAGPFKLTEWRRGDQIIMTRDPNYYGGSPDVPPVGPAKVDRVILKVVPENASRVAALIAGDVDIITELPPSAIKQVSASDKAMVAKVNGTRTFFMSINTAKKPFNDLRVRQALNHAVDRKLIIDKVLGGTATALKGVMSPDAFAFNKDLPEYAYDPAKAKALLAAAGLPNGLDLTIDTVGAFKDTAEAVAATMAKAGIRAKVQVWEGAVLNPMWMAADKRADRDLFFTSWGNGALDPSDIMVPTLRTGGRGNAAGYSNAEVDKLLDAAEVEVDVAKRRDMYLKAQALVTGDAPWVFLWLPQDLYGVSKRVKGWRPSADSRLNLADASVD
jgi:peptide/nickel transport system substrate-binding protein